MYGSSVIPDNGNEVDGWEWVFCQVRASLVVRSSGFLTDAYEPLLG
jgi:hypothetical protein